MNALLRTVCSLRLLEVRLDVNPLARVSPDLAPMLPVSDCLKGGVNPLATGLATADSMLSPSPATLWNLKVFLCGEETVLRTCQFGALFHEYD